MAQVIKSTHPTKHYSKGGCVKKFNAGGEVGTPLINPEVEKAATGSATYSSDQPSMLDRIGKALSRPMTTPPAQAAPAPTAAPNRVGTPDKGLAPEATNPTRGMSPAQAAAYFKNKGK